MDYDPIPRTGSSVPSQSVDEFALQRDLQEAEEEKRRKKLEAIQAAALQQQEEVAATEQAAAQQKLNAKPQQNIGAALQGGIEVPTAVVGGLIDFADDTIEAVGKLAGQEWEAIPDDWGPQNKTPWGKALRGIISFVGPTIGLGSLTKAGIVGLTKAASIGKFSKAADLVGKLGVDMAAGTAVDVINRHTEGDNLIRTLKDNIGGAVGWIPDDWATLDTDSPDIKKKKNILEGAGLGFLGFIIEGGVAWARALKGVTPGVQFIPKDDTAKKGFQEITNKSPVPKSTHPLVDRVLKDSENAQKHIDEMAEVELNQYGGDINNVDQFSPNIHSQVADESETIPRVVRPDGIPQAMVDAARIQDNIGTVDGRMSNFFTDSAIKALGFDDLEGRTLIKSIEKAIKALGNFEAKLPNGRMMTHKELLAAGDNLAATILDPKLTGKDLHRLFDRFDLRDMKEVAPGAVARPITDTARLGAERALTELKSLYLNMDTARASAYFQASQAGDIADMATAARNIGDEVDVTEIQQRIMEKMESLWYEVEMNKSIAGWALNNQKTFGELVKNKDSAAIARLAKAAKREFKSTVRAKAEANAAFIDQILEMNRSNPEYVKPLMMAYEFTNGDVNTIHKLNKYMGNVLGVVRKGFIDGEPEIPSQVVQGLFGTFYNLKLSSLLTPVKALSNNFALLLMKPANVMLGAVLRGDTKIMHRAWVQYATHMDTTMRSSMQYMGDMFKRVSADPESIAARADFITTNKKSFEIAKEYAAAQAANGNYGAMYRVNFVEMMRKINNWQGMRYSMNMMEAGDAFVKASIGMAEARGRAYDELLKNGSKITAKTLEDAADTIYKGMFDADGMLTDKAVKYASSEIAMNLDNELASGLNNLLAKAPILKTIVMFPRTSINVLDFVNKHSPLSYFIGDLNKIRTLKDADEIAEFLTTKGIEPSEANWKIFRAEVEGRVAMGTMISSAAAWMFASNNLTGNGNYDKQVTKFQQNAGDKPLRSWRGIDGKWRSYDGIEPISTFLALTADVLENIDTLGSTTAENFLQKIGYALSMNLTNKSFLQGLQPLTELLSGQPAALSRWTSNVASVGLFNQMSRIITPGLREVDTDLQSMLRNKWNILDQVGVGQALPMQYDFIDGTVVGREDPLSNFFNNLLPFKTSSNPSPVKQFLIEAEFDVQPSLKSSLKQIKYDASQRSRLAQIMGESGFFAKGIELLMNDPKVQKDLEDIRKLRAAGVTSTQAELSDSYTHIQIKRLLNQTVKYAKTQLANEIPDIRLAELKALRTKQAQKNRNAPAVLNLQNK
jgi:hypothetical protein